MARRTRDQFAVKVGERIRQLREERKLTRESLSYDYEIASKGTISDIENGYVRASMPMLKAIASVLQVDVLDLVTFPEEHVRHELIDATRGLPASVLKRLLAEARQRR